MALLSLLLASPAGVRLVFPTYPPPGSPSLTALISGHVLCLGVTVASGAVPRHGCGGCSAAGEGSDPYPGWPLTPGRGHSTGWDQLWLIALKMA